MNLDMSATEAVAVGEPNPESPLSELFAGLRPLMWGLGGVSLVINLLMLTGPLFMLQVYDRVLVSNSVPTLVGLGLLALILYLFFGVLDALRSRVLYRVGQHVDETLSARALAISTALPARLGAKGRNLRPVQDLESITQFMSGNGPAAIFDLPWLPFYLALVFLFHSLLGAVALAGVLIIAILVGLNELACRNPTKSAAHQRARRTSRVEEGRKNAEAVFAMGMSEALSKRWNAENTRFLADQRHAADRNGLFTHSIKTVRLILQSGILAVGALLAIQQEISPGVMIACSIITMRALSPVEQAMIHWRGFVAARQSLGRLRGMLALPLFGETEHELPAPHKTLVVENVYCSPAGATDPVIRNVSFDAQAGDGIAILGASGSGKSTLIRAIIGAATMIKGSIRFDGAELDQWSPAARSAFIGYLPQDLQLFEGTVAQNIARFDPQATSKDIMEAALIANVHDLITALPKGYNTPIGSEGVALSGGQRQRIALARALYGKPFVIILDEPNSNLDAEGEAALAKAIMTMRARGKIVLLVAHRPRAIGAVNKALCLKDGRTVAFGPRDEIMRRTLTPVDSQKTEAA